MMIYKSYKNNKYSLISLFIKQKLQIFLYIACIAIFIPAPPCQANADTDDDQSLTTFSFYLENDYFVNDDSQYTNGLKFAWSSPVHTGMIRMASASIKPDSDELAASMATVM